ncbi:MAG: glutamate-5-semialdehyde dehydrogenase [archaeon]
MNVREMAELAKKSSVALAVLSNNDKTRALEAIGSRIKEKRKDILAANRLDLESAKCQVESGKISPSMLDRLKLDDSKIDELVQYLNGVAVQADPVGKTLSSTMLDDGLELYKVSCPIGVIAAIFESRPDAVIQISALCIKSGNAVILKGGSEASNSTAMLHSIMAEALERSSFPAGAVQLVETREDIGMLLALDNLIDLVIPRGGSSLVKYIKENTKIPVLGHTEGICHVYVDRDADLQMAAKIVVDSKLQYTAACNAAETLLVHADVAERFLPLASKKLTGVELRGCKMTRDILKGTKAAGSRDWSTEYGDKILSVKVVNSLQEAIIHINTFGSKHTDAIITDNRKSAMLFLQLVDSANVFWNASTRFSDGYRYGLGAEVGISTNKIHARGPVGLEGLVIYKYLLIGKGQVVSEYSGGTYKHAPLNKTWKNE